MTERRTIAAAAVLAGVLAGAACTPSTTVQVGTVTIQEPTSPPSQPPSGGDSECSNDYFPSDEDATWEYAGETNVLGPHHTTKRITESNDDGFTMSMSTSTGDVVLNLKYACVEGDLIMLNPIEQIAGSAVGPDGTAVITTRDQTGITLPAELQAANAWQQYVEGTLTSSEVTMNMTYTFDNVARGLEVVTIPFGTFDAMRVDTETEGTLEGQYSGTCQTSTWYVKDIGVVKEVTICEMGPSTVEVSIELESYDAP